MLRNTHIWIIPYIRHRLASLAAARRPRAFHIIFCVADHFEPLWGGADDRTGAERIARWVMSYEKAAVEYCDSDGRRPRHTYFFPVEEYRESFAGALSGHCGRGFGEIEVHLHHDRDTPERLESTLQRHKEQLARHGLLGIDRSGNTRYGFVHGNWALDNARPDGRWCGVNNEISILHRTGCFADFTLPSAPSATQTATINSIYYAIDDPRKPKSHDRGIAVRVGGAPPSDGDYLMIIQGPLMLDWKWRSRGLFPRIENSDISMGHPPMRHRWELWTRASVGVAGRPEWIFVKVHTHGCCDGTYQMLFHERGFDRLHLDLAAWCRDSGRFDFHYVTAREMYNIVKASEAGAAGNPFDHRDYEIDPPSFAP